MTETKPYFSIDTEILSNLVPEKFPDFIKNHTYFQPVIKAAENLGIDAFVIGGWVRDLLLQKLSKDVDIVTTNDGISLAKETSRNLDHQKVHIFKTYGTAMIKSPEMEYEFVGARKESYNFDSRKPLVQQGTLLDDQQRRDFTINTLSIRLTHPNQGELIDPFGGIDDIRNGIIRTPMDPVQTYSDDPLRMMRAIRFAAQLGFTIHPESLAAISSQKHRIEIISKERIHVELEKIMLSPQPSIGFLLLENTGLLEILIPELVALKGVSEVEGQSHKENFYHTLEVVDNISKSTDNLWLRYAALFHDIGKAPTKRFDKKLGFTFHGHEAVGSKMIAKIFKRLKLPLDDKLKYVQKMVFLSSRPIALVNENVSDSGVRRLLYDAGADIDDLMILCDSDITSKNPARIRKYRNNFREVRKKLKEVEERDQISNFQPPISGEDIMKAFNLTPCKEIGVIKNQIKEAVLNGDIQNDKTEAYELMVKIGAQLGLKLLPA
jgi:tRNA nucleotidyltransferase (CCA-adding enzyme)